MPDSVPVFAAAASLVVICRKQRGDLKLGAEAGQSRAWAAKPNGPDPIGFLGAPRKPDEYFDNPLDTASGLFSIREDAQEVQRNPSNYSTTSRDALLLPSQPSPTDGSPRKSAGVQHGRRPLQLPMLSGHRKASCADARCMLRAVILYSINKGIQQASNFCPINNQ